MPSIEKSLQFEEGSEPNKIRLVISGDFARAYNRSAWRFYTCISKYKVIRKFFKQEQKEIYFIGFPEAKLFDLIGTRNCSKRELGYEVELREDEIPAEDGYEAWTKEVPTEMSSRAETAALPPSGRELMSAICQRIRAFPLEVKTPVEALVFLSEMRKLLVQAESER